MLIGGLLLTDRPAFSQATTQANVSLKLKQVELLSVDKDIHTFENLSDEVVEFIVFRYLPSYKNQSEMIKNDKEIIER